MTMSIFEKTMRLFDKTKEAADKRALTKGVTGPGPRGARPWSVDGETITVVLDRRTAENAYYALALALGGVDRPEAVGEWTGKMTGKTHKGNGKTVGKAYP